MRRPPRAPLDLQGEPPSPGRPGPPCSLAGHPQRRCPGLSLRVTRPGPRGPRLPPGQHLSQTKATCWQRQRWPDAGGGADPRGRNPWVVSPSAPTRLWPAGREQGSRGADGSPAYIRLRGNSRLKPEQMALCKQETKPSEPPRGADRPARGARSRAWRGRLALARTARGRARRSGAVSVNAETSPTRRPERWARFRDGEAFPSFAASGAAPGYTSPTCRCRVSVGSSYREHLGNTINVSVDWLSITHEMDF